MTADLPYGTEDLDPRPVVAKGEEKRIKCYVRGCSALLRPPAKGFRGDVCPEHGIRCHHSSTGGTYGYAEPERNVFASREIFRSEILNHPLKFESHRLGLERSEDTVSWNVFRSFQEAGQLHRIAAAITGDAIAVEPFLYLWGIGIQVEDFSPWSLLLDARRQFEQAIPVDRPLTEPDIALHLPGRYLILIEAKFTSRNTWYEKGRRKTASSLTTEELLTIYHDPSLRILDHDAAVQRTRIYHQLWRNMVFAEWMARNDHPCTQPFHVNLVRKGYDEQSVADFRSLIRGPYQAHFRRLTWETLYFIAERAGNLSRLQQYMRSKTAGLVHAFRIPDA